jgi:signal transduction histidine kinase
MRILALKVLEKLDMQHVLFVAFTVVAALPVLTLAFWVQEHAVRQQVEWAADEHLLAARNLSTAISRYVNDLKASFDLAIATFYSGEQANGLERLLTSLDFQHISVVNGKTGAVERYFPGLINAASPHLVLQPETFAALSSSINDGSTGITELRRDVAGDPAFFLLKALPDGRIAYGVVDTRYLQQLQKGITLGAHGYALVLDQRGSVIAHPVQKWVATEFDLSGSQFFHAIAGKTGVMQFESAPDNNAEMVAAYTQVPETGWHIMVLQPVKELYRKANDVRTPAVLIAILGLLAAGTVSWLLAKYIAYPLQSVGAAAGAIAHGDMTVRAPSFSPLIPREVHELSASFNHMVDELRRTNAALADAAARAEAANRAKSEFLANMSHELRTPLNAILGFSEVMRDGLFGPLANPRYQGYAADINTSATHLVKVISDILDLSKVEAGAISVELAPVSIGEIFETTARLVEKPASDRKVAIEIASDPQILDHTIETDGGKLTQILLNLVSNSIKFTKPGGFVRLAAEIRQDAILFAVADNGIGIAHKDMAKVLKPFGQVASAYTTTDGLGLGLPLSKKLAERLGGGMTIESKLEHGTTVYVWLPLLHGTEKESGKAEQLGPEGEIIHTISVRASAA